MRFYSDMKQPGWKVTVVHYIAKTLGLLVHVEGYPFGSSRNIRRDYTNPDRSGQIVGA